MKEPEWYEKSGPSRGVPQLRESRESVKRGKGNGFNWEKRGNFSGQIFAAQEGGGRRDQEKV